MTERLKIGDLVRLDGSETVYRVERFTEQPAIPAVVTVPGIATATGTYVPPWRRVEASAINPNSYSSRIDAPERRLRRAES